MSFEPNTPTDPRPATETQEAPVKDLRGQTTSRRDLSEHRRHTWLYEDLLA